MEGQKTATKLRPKVTGTYKIDSKSEHISFEIRY